MCSSQPYQILVADIVYSNRLRSHDVCRLGYTNSWYPNPSGSHSPPLSKTTLVSPPWVFFNMAEPDVDIVSPSQLTLKLRFEGSRWIEVRVREALVPSRVEERPDIGHGASSYCARATAAKRQIHILQRVHEKSHCRFRSNYLCHTVRRCGAGPWRRPFVATVGFSLFASPFSVLDSVCCGVSVPHYCCLWLLKSPWALTSMQESHSLPAALCLYAGVWAGFGGSFMTDCHQGGLGRTVATIFEDPSITPSDVEINQTGSQELLISGTGFNRMVTPVMDFDPPVNSSNLDVEVSSHEVCVLRDDFCTCCKRQCDAAFCVHFPIPRTMLQR